MTDKQTCVSLMSALLAGEHPFHTEPEVIVTRAHALYRAVEKELAPAHSHPFEPPASFGGSRIEPVPPRATRPPYMIPPDSDTLKAHGDEMYLRRLRTSGTI